MCPTLLTSLLLICAFANVNADDAIDWQGKTRRGELVNEVGTWVFRIANGKNLSIKQIAYIRFASAATPLPKAPLTNTLHLPHQQRVAGMLRSIDAKKLEFVTSWGKTLPLNRDQVVGIEQARILLYDDFEQSPQAWQLDGKLKLDRDRSFHGAASLLLDAKQRATRTWKPALADGDIRLYFYDLANGANARFSFDLILETAKEPIRTFNVDNNGYACDKLRDTFGVLKPTAGWHQLSLELRDQRLRIYVDDTCLGEHKTPALNGVRISSDAGKLWIDELIVTQRLPALTQPPPAKDDDTLWLTQGEQLFGQLLSADRQSATLESKLGKRALPWSQLRGIFFAQSKKPTDTHDPEITFRPAPGFPLDQLRAKLLRWEGGKLIVQHALLGEIALERDRLDKIRWLAK